jgi:RNA polymerase sigma-70 factor (ECF subfamily)
MVPAEADAALVARALGGDGHAFGTLLERHRPGLLVLCRRLVGDGDLAEDCVQDASLVALLRLDRLRSPDQFGWWLRGIGVRTCRRALHGRETRQPLSTLTEGEEAWRRPDDEPSADETLALSEVRRSLRAAVQDLPPGQRAAVDCFYLAGMSYQEAAASLGIGAGALKVRLHKARAALQARFHVSRTPDAKGEAQALRRATRRDLAAHEAGHAVLHALSGGAVGHLSIVLDDERRGVGVVPRGPGGELGVTTRDALAALMGGEAANAMQRSRLAATSGASDRAAAARLAAELTGGDPVETALLVDQALANARSRLADDRTWRLVERVARALVERRTLDGDEFRQLVSR